MRKRMPTGLRVLTLSVLTLIGAGLVATPATAQQRPAAAASGSWQARTSAAILDSCSSRLPGDGYVYARAFVGTTSCSQCIAAGWDGVHGGAWRGFTCWTSVAGPGDWRTHELWVRGY
ncbi:hypothetical protein [Nonomuraea diastatica]|uniref:Uncharacterized protein n=1 Tax=Nonomuraea diastatica TaxID=1848329 RepID=A0A4V6PD31_9ACTN|nr:hypothetical protein [Nonomuraea diastatica]TDD20106.1 hypothetical protein E1294_18850 [Nonomuraea diastatica]